MPYYIDKYRARDGKRPRTYYCDEQELLDIANQIRRAGGADALDAFFPSNQGDEKTCLIATSLNFGCTVCNWPTGCPKSFWPSGDLKWVMVVDTVRQAKALAKTMGWDIVDIPGYRNHIILPEKVGNTAAAFDEGKGWTKKYVIYE